MTRTDVMASSRPHTARVAPMRRGSSGVARRLSIVPAVLLLGLALAGPSAAVAAESTSGYNQTPNTPTTTTTTTTTTTPATSTTPTTGTSPSKESKTPTTTTPANETAPATTSTTPTTTTQAKASTLPFTGFDLRWSLAIGVLLIAAGFSIVAVQRRQSRSSRH
jgi:hypothetical protein